MCMYVCTWVYVYIHSLYTVVEDKVYIHSCTYTVCLHSCFTYTLHFASHSQDLGLWFHAWQFRISRILGIAFRNWQQGGHGIGRAVAAIDQPFNATLCACAWDLCTPELNSNLQLRDSRVGMWKPPPSRSHAHLCCQFLNYVSRFLKFSKCQACHRPRFRACDSKCSVHTQYLYIVCIHSCTYCCTYTVAVHARCTYTYTYNVHIHSCRYTVYMHNCHILHRIHKRMSRTFIWLS